MAKSKTEIDGIGTPEVFSGTATTTAVTITPTGQPKLTKIVNRSKTKELQWSFDNSTFATMLPYSQDEIHGSYSSLYLKTASGTADYSVNVTTKPEGAV